MAHDPVVFISSTSDDLKDHREQAAKAARAIGFSTRMMEDFPASGHAPPLRACLEKVEKRKSCGRSEELRQKEHYLARMRARLAGPWERSAIRR